MTRNDARPQDRPRGGLSRRDFLHYGSAAGLGLGLGLAALPAGYAAPGASGPPVRDRRCILLFLVGGPSQLDTWDPKPDAPSEFRSPFAAIATRAPGVRVTEVFPKLARVMDKVSLVRTLHHEAPAVHDAGHQLLQTGRFYAGGAEQPHYGSVLAAYRGEAAGMPPHVLMPRPIGRTGGNMPHGQTAGLLGPEFDPLVLGAGWGFILEGGDASSRFAEALDDRAEPESIRRRYGSTPFGRDCLRARRLVERGTRFVTVNMYTSVLHEPSWDTHGTSPFTPTSAIRDDVGPTFDAAFSALIGDLDARGVLADTLVLAVGEFGRTPRINPSGGRDHHPACWTALFAGGGVQGGRVVGASDATASAPADRPVTPAEVAATVYHSLGVPPDATIRGTAGAFRPVDAGVGPILELF